MGFDNECILNIQSLPGEYFCPVCRTLIYPNEALQSQCTHLYCKPCLAYIVATTHACPYDGYLVTEADSKPLIESNATLAETIGKVTVYCLYHRSGCQWQGTLSECITHCTSCTFGNSPVVCNRCGTQIIHRQVQEHTQICPGLQPQSQQVDNGQSQASTVSNQAASQDAAVAASAAPSSTTSTATATAVIAASAATPVTPAAVPTPASMPAFSTTSMTAPALQSVAQASMPQQWYQQQQLEHQQYYQMYPVYDPNQRHYHQYAQYQQQAYPQYAQPQLQTQPAIQGQQQPSYVQTQPHHQGQPHSQPQSQTQSQVQGQPLPQLQAQAAQMQQQQQLLVQTQPQSLPQPQSQTQLSAQPAQMQVQPSATGQQPNIQPHSQTIPVPQGQIAGQSFGQPLPHAPQVPLQQQMQALPHQQTLQQQQPQSLPQHHLHTQPQVRPSSLQQTQLQPQLHPLYPSAYPQSQSQQSVQSQHPPAYAGHQSYQQPQILQQTQPVAPPQRPMVMHPQQQVVAQQHPVQLPNQLIPQQPPRMAPPSGHTQMQVQQQPMLPPAQRPAASHPPQQPQVPAHHQGQQMHQHPGLQSQAPQLGMPPQQSHGHLHPGQQFPQGMSLPHQQIPHGPHVHSAAQPLQQNVPSSQGLATHQTQAVAGRAMVGNNTMPSQFLNQQSPNDLAQSGTNLPLLHESQNSHLPQSVSDGYSLSLSGGPRSGVADKVNHATDMLTEIATKNTDGSVDRGSSVDIKVRESDSEAVTKKAVGDGKDSDKQLELDLALLPERSCNSGADEENVEAAESKHTVKEESADLPEEGTERSHAHKEERPDENQSEIKYDVLAEVQTDANMQVHSISGAKTREPFGSSIGQNMGEIPGKTPHPQQLTAPNSERSYLQQPSHQYAAPTNEGASIQPGYHGTNMSQLTWQGPPHIPSAGSLPGKEGYPQHTPYGHPSNIPPASPRFPAPDRILTPHISQPGGIHDRRPQEGPPYQLQVPGQNIASAHMRPSSQSFPDHLPRQGQPSMVQELLGHPSGQPYGGGYPSDPLHGGLPGPGVPSTVRVPGHVGFPQQGFPEHGIIAQGQTQSHLSQPHAGGGIPHGDTLTRPPQLLPHSGPFNSPNQMVQRGPVFHPDDQGGLPHVGPSNSLDPEIYGIRRPGFSDVRQPDPLGQPNLIKVNGIPGKMQGDGMLNTAFMHGLAEDRFKTFPNENFRPLPEEGMPRPYPLDLSRHNVGRREFEEDLNPFPRPAHLDPEGVKNFDNYNMRPLVRGSQQAGPDGLTRPFDRALPRPDGPFSAFPAKQSGPYSAIRSGSEHHMLDVETRRSAILREEFGRHMDIPSLQNPNIDFSGLPSSRFGSGGKPRLDEIDPRELHGFTERSKAFSLPSDLSAGSFTDNKAPLPSMLVPGSLPDRFLQGLPDGPRSLRTVEQLDSGNFPGSFKKDFDGREISRGHTYPGELFSQSRISTGEPSFGCGYGRDFPNAMEPFSIKRKPGTMGWCRLCNVDCETVEGLDLHAQTREHQKMAMEIVLAIKRENNKKQRTAVGVVTHDDSNKSSKIFSKPLK